MKILIVDDSRAMRMIVKRSLGATDRFRGATVVEAGNGLEAVAVVRDERPDLILSDWNMPEMDGLALLKAARAEGFSGPIGMITSESTPDMHDIARTNGVAFVVMKPFTPQGLERALSGVVV